MAGNAISTTARQSCKLESALIPSQHTALLVPVAEDDSRCRVTVDHQFMNGGPVRVAVDHAVDRVTSERLSHGFRIHIHDVRCGLVHGIDMRLAACTHFLRQALALA